MAKLTIVSFPSRQQQTTALDETSPLYSYLSTSTPNDACDDYTPAKQLLKHYEEFIMAEVVNWPVVRELLERTSDPRQHHRLFCHIEVNTAPFFGDQIGNPLYNKSYIPPSFQFEMSSWYRTPPVKSEDAFATIILCNLVERNVLVLVGCLTINPMNTVLGEELPPKTVSDKLQLSMVRKREVGDSSFAYSGRLGVARLHTTWLRYVDKWEFNFVGEDNGNLRQSTVATASSPKRRTVIQLNASHDPYEQIWQAFIKCFQKWKSEADQPALGDTIAEWLNIPVLVKNNYERALLGGRGWLYNLQHPSDNSDSCHNETEMRQRLLGLIAFALYIYPYEFWSSYHLLSFTHILLPESIRQLALQLEETPDLPPSSAFGSWTSLKVNTFFEQFVRPVMTETYRHLLLHVGQATEDSNQAWLLRRYREIRQSVSRRFKSSFLILATPRNTSNGAAYIPYNTQLENFSVLFASRVANKSVKSAGIVHESTRERPFADSHLKPLSPYFPTIVLRKEAPVAAKQTGLVFSFSLATDGNYAAARQEASSTNNKTTANDASRLLDIEDMGEEAAPACLKRVMRAYKNLNSEFGHNERLHLQRALIAAFAWLTGRTEDYLPHGNVTDKDKRDAITDLVRAWYKHFNYERYLYIENKEKYNQHDFGPDLYNFLKQYEKDEKGASYAYGCVCAPRSNMSMDRASGNEMAYICPHLPNRGLLHSSYSEAEKKEALRLCAAETQDSDPWKLSTSRTNTTDNNKKQAVVTYHDKPFKILADGCIRRGKKRRQNRLNAAMAASASME